MLLGIMVTVCPQRAATAGLRVSVNLSGALFSVKHVEHYFVDVYFHLFGDAVG